jgi:hypothetical protein
LAGHRQGRNFAIVGEKNPLFTSNPGSVLPDINNYPTDRQYSSDAPIIGFDV